MKTHLDRSLGFYQTAMNVQAKRHEIIASNIANADTPYFKARDIDFRTALRSVLAGGGGSSLTLATSSASHITSPGASDLNRFVGFRRELQSSVDGNTVDMDIERAAFAENTIHYEASVTFINSLLRGMQRAISGQ